MKIPIIVQNISAKPADVVFPVKKPAAWRNGVIVRMPNHLGDAVMALPALTELKAILPACCGLFVVTPNNLRQLYDSLPVVDAVISLTRPHRCWSCRDIKVVRQLRAGVGVLFNHSIRDALALRMARVPLLFGAAARGRSFLLTRAFHFPERRPGDPAASHQTGRYLALVAALGAGKWNGSLPEFRPPNAIDELEYPLDWLCRHPMILTLAAGAAYGAAKRWPQENFSKVAEYWIRHGGVVAVLGSASEAPIGEAVCAPLPQSKCFNLCGKTDLFALIHLYRHAAFNVANDSGLMHLGAALGCHGLAVFGPTDWSDTGPISDHWKLLCDPPECAPCLRHVCPKGNAECMTRLTPAAVIRELTKSVRELRLPWRKASRHFEREAERL